MTQNMHFSIRVSLINATKSARNWRFVTFIEEILHGKIHFYCSAWKKSLLFKETESESVRLTKVQAT